MHAVKTEFTNQSLLGPEDSDIASLPCERLEEMVKSVWRPTDLERARIAAGDNIELLVLGEIHPPVALSTTSEIVLE